LAYCPTDNANSALTEAKRGLDELGADEIAVTAHYNDIWLSDPRLEKLWEELDRRGETVHVHPNAYTDGSMGRPAPLIEVAFETARNVVDMLYSGMIERYPNIRFIMSVCPFPFFLPFFLSSFLPFFLSSFLPSFLPSFLLSFYFGRTSRRADGRSPCRAHCGGAFPALAGRLELLGSESWVPHHPSLTSDRIPKLLSKLYVDTAAAASIHTLAPAIEVVGPEHIAYGSDHGVQCSTSETIQRNRERLLGYEGMRVEEREAIGRRGWELFPRARRRWESTQGE